MPPGTNNPREVDATTGKLMAPYMPGGVYKTFPKGTYAYNQFDIQCYLLHLKDWKILREPLDCTGNEPKLDILIEALGRK